MQHWFRIPEFWEQLAGAYLEIGKVEALMMMGTAYSDQGFYSQSIETFEPVREIGGDTERGNAERWIEFAKEMQAYQAKVAAPQ